jgi:hypothetical protein
MERRGRMKNEMRVREGERGETGRRGDGETGRGGEGWRFILCDECLRTDSSALRASSTVRSDIESAGRPPSEPAEGSPPAASLRMRTTGSRVKLAVAAARSLDSREKASGSPSSAVFLREQ